MMHTPSKTLVKEVRAILIMQGTSLNAVCKANGLHRQAVTAALSGERLGPKSKALGERFLALVGFGE